MRTKAWITLAFLGVLIVGGFLYGGNGTLTLDAALQAPSWQHPMGTDELGRDVLTRVAKGTALSLSISIVAWAVALVIGILFGTIAGYYSRKAPDLIISWFISLAYMTPFMVFLIALLGILGTGIIQAYLILILFAWAAPARQTRVAVKSLKSAPYLTAAESFGFSTKQLFRFVIVPRVYKPALYASLAFLPEVIALDAGLSFFGLGVQPPVPSLGKMIADGLNYMSVAWWVFVFPLLLLALACLAVRIFYIYFKENNE